MAERRIPTQEERSAFMLAVPELLKDRNVFVENSEIVRAGALDLLLSARVLGSDKLTTSTYKVVNGNFERLNSIVDGDAVKKEVIVIPLVRDHFAPLED